MTTTRPVSLQARVPEDLRHELKLHALTLRITTQEAITRAVRMYLAREATATHEARVD